MRGSEEGGALGDAHERSPGEKEEKKRGRFLRYILLYY
jgi:hypothetical protein